MWRSRSALHSGSPDERKADYPLACEVNTTRQCFVAQDPKREGLRRSLVIGAFVWLVARRRGFAGYFAAALPAKVANLFLCGRNQPEAAT
jgi:hypothetical protein